MSPPASNRRSRRRRQRGAARPAPSLPRVSGGGLEAALGETGATVPPVSRDIAAPAAEAIEADPTVRPRRGVRPSGQRRERGRLYRLTHPRFISEVIEELRKVTWPSQAETRNLTTVVVIVAAAAAVYLAAVDIAFNRLLENVLVP